MGRFRTAIDRAISRVASATNPSQPQPYPEKAVVLYHMMYSNSDVNDLEDYYFPSTINVVNLAFAQGDPLGLVGWTIDGQTIFAQKVARLRRKGVRIVLSVGGGGNYINTTNRTSFVNSFMAINSIIPLDGIDWNIESNAMINQADIVAISRELKTRRGSNFSVTLSASGSFVDTYLSIAKALQDVGLLTMYGQQFYDVEVNAPALRHRLDQAVSYGISPRHLSVGMMVDGDGINNWDIPTSLNRYQYAKSLYPNLRGSYLWVQTTNTAALQWANVVGSEVKS